MIIKYVFSYIVYYLALRKSHGLAVVFSHSVFHNYYVLWS